MIALIYHDVSAPEEREEHGFPGPLAARYKLTPEQFLRHLTRIAAASRPVGRISGIVGLPEVALTFDDGGSSAPSVADRLEEHGWFGHFFITTDRIGTKGFLTVAQIRDLSARGHVIGSHSASHPTYMASLSGRELDDEWRRSRETLADVLSHAPTICAVPGGVVSRAVLRSAAANGYEIALTSDPRPRPHHVDGLVVVGRFTVWAGTSPERVAAIVQGNVAALARARVSWAARKPLKRLSPRMYQAARRAWSRVA